MSSAWVEATDSATNRVYYYNKDTKQTQWTRPADMEEAKSDPADEQPANWAESTDGKTGRKYYYNKLTKKTSWTKPRCLVTPAHSRNASLTNLPAVQPLPLASISQTATVSSSPRTVGAAASPPHSATTSPRTTIAQRGPPPLPQAISATAPVLPQANWAEAKDPSSGRSYWYNRETKETTWVNPNPATTTSMTMNPLTSTASSTQSVAGTMTSAMGQSYHYTANANGTLTRDVLQAMQGLQVGGTMPVEESKQPPQEQRRDLHSLLDMDDEGPSSEDDADSAAASPTTSKPGTLSPADSAALTTQSVRATLESDEQPLDATQLHFAKHRKGWFKRTFRVGSAFSGERLMEYKKSLIKKSLLKENRHLDAVAVQLFKNLMSYMGDRKSSKGSKDHCKKILKLCLSAPTGIRDEVYVQLMKQTTKNPRKESERKGWEVLTQCLSFFPPSKMIVDTVRDYIEKTIQREGGQLNYCQQPANLATIRTLNRDQHTVLSLAYLSLVYLPLVTALGQRLNVPCEYELNAIVEFTPMFLSIFTCHDGLSHAVKVDAFSRVKDITSQMSTHFGITSGHDLTALYESQGNDPAIFSQFAPPATKPALVDFALVDTKFTSARKLNEERLCDEDIRVLDIISNWENVPLVEEMSADDGDEGYNSAFVKKEDKLYKKNKKELNKMNLDEIIQEKIDKEKTHNLFRFNRLVYKFRIVAKITEPALSHDKEAVTMLFFQLFRDTVIERYPIIDKDVTTLVALYLQSQYGNFSAEKWTVGRLASLAQQFVPWSFLPSPSSGQADAFLQTILSKYAKLTNFTSYEAMLSYLDYCQANQYYGQQSFLVEQRQFQEHPNILLLTVTCDSVLLLHPGTNLERELLDGGDGGKEKARDLEKERERREREKKENKMKILENFSYSDLVTWGNSDEKFILVIGNIIQQRKLILKTKEGKVINALIHEYVKRKVAARERATSK